LKAHLALVPPKPHLFGEVFSKKHRNSNLQYIEGLQGENKRKFEAQKGSKNWKKVQKGFIYPLIVITDDINIRQNDVHIISTSFSAFKAPFFLPFIGQSWKRKFTEEYLLLLLFGKKAGWKRERGSKWPWDSSRKRDENVNETRKMRESEERGRERLCVECMKCV